VNEQPTYLTVAEAALWLECSERTVRRWMTGRLLAIYERGDGKLVLELKELTRLHRAQQHRNPVQRQRSNLRAQRFAQVASMTYPRD